jgi:hypothetical protein
MGLVLIPIYFAALQALRVRHAALALWLASMRRGLFCTKLLGRIYHALAVADIKVSTRLDAALGISWPQDGAK